MADPDIRKDPRKVVYRYAYRRAADQDVGRGARHPVVVVGAGPVGLVAALDLASRHIPVVLLDDADRIGLGSGKPWLPGA